MFRHQSRREAGYRKHVPDAFPVRTAAGRAQADDGKPSKPASQPRGENTGDRPGRMSALSGHSSGLVVRRAGFFSGFSFSNGGAAPPGHQLWSA